MTENSKTLEQTVQVVKHSTKGHGELLSYGYGMTVEEAKQIIAERDKDPHTHPYERYRDAKAMLAALDTKPVVMDPKPGWKRKRR